MTAVSVYFTVYIPVVPVMCLLWNTKYIFLSFISWVKHPEVTSIIHLDAERERQRGWDGGRRETMRSKWESQMEEGKNCTGWLWQREETWDDEKKKWQRENKRGKEEERKLLGSKVLRKADIFHRPCLALTAYCDPWTLVLCTSIAKRVRLCVYVCGTV